MPYSPSIKSLALSIIVALVAALPAVAQTPPATFQWNASYLTESHVIDFELHSARGPNFGVEVQGVGGAFSTHAPGPVRTYIGTIAALPGAMASALRRADGSTYFHVLFEDGAEWINNGGATTLRTDPQWTQNYPLFVTGAGGAGSNIWAAELGVDLPSSQYSIDGDVDAALEMVEHSVNTTNLIYLRDAGVIHRLGRVVVRTDAASDPYAGMTTTGALLGEIPNQWDNVLPPSTHDLALVATSATGGGLASVGVIGNPGYSANGATSEGDFSIVWRHEAGHNWSLNHFDGGTPEGKTINSGNSLSRMSGSEQAKAVAHRVARSVFLDNLGPYTREIPPHASLDRYAYAPQSAGIAIDVLDNDHDANGDSFNITDFDTCTALGGSVVLSPGTGVGGRDELLYTPPITISSTPDLFTYRITDQSGREAVGNVITKLTSDSDLLAHFSMDAGIGTVARDSSAYARHATLDGGPVWSTGTIGGGITFDGVDARLLADALGHATANLTVSGWIKRNGPQTSWAGIAFSRGGSTAAGLNFGTSNELRYHWNGAQWPWNSGLVVPDNTWTFVALAVTPTAATIYMNSGTGMQSATNIATHNAEAFDTQLSIGHDPHSAPRKFKGQMDDIRIYGRTLSAAEITGLATGLGSASDPSPEYLASVAAPTIALSWTSSPAATNHRIYLSTSYADVRDGLPAADQGLEAASAWTTPTLTSGTWYWRVDTTDGINWAEGPVWSFANGPVSTICFLYSCMGDGGDQLGCTDCPCGNNAPIGSSGGCLNSAGTGTQLIPSGSPSTSLPPGNSADLRFAADGAPPSAFCILNSGDAVAPGNIANPCFGMKSGAQAAAFDGLRCAITNTRRHGGRSADASGRVGFANAPWGGESGPPAGIANAGGGFAAGQTRYFQIINRDDALTVCMRGLNTSQAVEVTFVP